MGGAPRLDRIDIRILAELQRNADQTNLALAEAVGLSASPCLARVKRLKQAGYITGYHARLNLAKLVEHITVFTEVTLGDHRREDFIRFEQEIRRYDTLVECHLVSGGYDYLLKFMARSVLRYQEMMEDILERRIGVDKYFSYIVIKSIIVRDGVPVTALLDDGQNGAGPA